MTAPLTRPPSGRLLAALRTDDDKELELVRAKLGLISARPEAVRVRVENACVILTGRVATSERARIVRSLATVRGVDSVIDLMTEEPAWIEAPTARVRWGLARRPWPIRIRVLSLGAGLGLALVGLRSRGLGGSLLALTGALLAARAVTNLSVRRARAK